MRRESAWPCRSWSVLLPPLDGVLRWFREIGIAVVALDGAGKIVLRQECDDDTSLYYEVLVGGDGGLEVVPSNYQAPTHTSAASAAERILARSEADLSYV
jgi:hypothetical protein